MPERYRLDLDSYVERTRSGPCFICKLVEGDPDFSHHIVYEDEDAIAFLNKYPTLYGYTLIAPKGQVCLGFRVVYGSVAHASAPCLKNDLQIIYSLEH